MDSPDRHEGGCFCGALRYAVRGAAVWKAACCCRTCVKMHASPYVVWAGFNRSAFAFLRGDPVAFRSSRHAVRRFCPRCGTTLTYEKEALGDPALEAAAAVIYVAVATLDDPEAYPPDEVVHARERIGWLDLGSSVPVREHLSSEAGHLQFGGIKGEE